MLSLGVVQSGLDSHGLPSSSDIEAQISFPQYISTNARAFLDGRPTISLGPSSVHPFYPSRLAPCVYTNTQLITPSLPPPTRILVLPYVSLGYPLLSIIAPLLFVALILLTLPILTPFSFLILGFLCRFPCTFYPANHPQRLHADLSASRSQVETYRDRPTPSSSISFYLALDF